jgi:hypothetical protein
MTREEVREAFEKAGWRISERTDYHLLVGEAEGYPSLSLLAREEVIGADDPAFEIVDRERNLTRRIRSIPAPEQAAALMEEHGGPPEQEG